MESRVPVAPERADATREPSGDHAGKPKVAPGSPPRTTCCPLAPTVTRAPSRFSRATSGSDRAGPRLGITMAGEADRPACQIATPAIATITPTRATAGARRDRGRGTFGSTAGEAPSGGSAGSDGGLASDGAPRPGPPSVLATGSTIAQRYAPASGPDVRAVAIGRAAAVGRYTASSATRRPSGEASGRQAHPRHRYRP